MKLTKLEQKVVTRIVLAAAMDHKIPLEMIGFSIKERNAAARAHQKLRKAIAIDCKQKAKDE